MPREALTATASGDRDTGFFGHPRGLATLFFTEMWERFSFYGMRALLILFMTASVAEGGLGFDVSKAGAVYGLYTAMVYLSALPGGWLADKLIGQRRAVLYGGVLISAGHFSMATPQIGFFYAGLALIVLGTGLLKPNVSAIVGQIYSLDDNRRDAGFSIFYMGINIGAFVSPLVCGYVGQRIDWHYGFGIAGIGMVIGLIQYTLGGKYLGEAGLRSLDAGDTGASKRILLIGLVGSTVVISAVVLLATQGVITAKQIADASGVLLVVVVLVFFVWLFSSGSWNSEERKRLYVIFLLFVAASLFWAVFEQAGSTLNLFAERDTRNMIFSYDFPASWFQSINSLFIITLAPVLAWIWISLRSKDPSSPIKFSFGLLFAGLGFVVMIGASLVAASGVQVSPMWLVLTYLLHTIGELCLSPVGLSAMTKLAPAGVAGLMMGVWFLSSSVGNYAAGRLAALYESLPLFLLFGAVGGTAICAALALFLFSKPIERLMGGVK
ncbi:MAG: peptide MFS transporter [Bryobacteraceae bacterium]